jgi:two-component system alkaline phosphatase synthesis response regulator PhoP
MIKDHESMKKSKKDKKLGKIMIVEDDLDQREMLVLMFHKEGFETETAEDGTEFLNRLDTFNPDIVTLDVMMPGLTTSEILKDLKDKKSKPKIILLTVVRYSEEEKKKIMTMGNIVDYIKKPFDLDDFMDAIKKHVPQ